MLRLRLLTQHNDEGKEVDLYYRSRTLVGEELNYYFIEKICRALGFPVKKLRQELRHFNSLYFI